MIEANATRNIVKRLLKKTKNRLVNWLPDPEGSGSLVVMLDRSVLDLSRITSRGQLDKLTFNLHKLMPGGRREPVASLVGYYDDGDEGIRELTEDEVDDSVLLTELYEQAKLVSSHLDDVVDDIDAALDSDKPIGHTPTEATHAERR